MSFQLSVSHAIDTDFMTVLGQELASLERELPQDAERLREIAEKLAFCTRLVRFVGGGSVHGFAVVHPRRKPKSAARTELVLDESTFYVRYLYVVPVHRSNPCILLRFLEDLVNHAYQSNLVYLCFDLQISEQFRRLHALLQTEEILAWNILKRGGTQYAIRYTCRLADAAQRLHALNR